MSRGEASAGGVRTIYYWAVEEHICYMLYVYAKNEQGDLTPAQNPGSRATGSGGIQMKAAAFEELLTSVRQAGEIRRGRRKPTRATTFKPADVKALRGDLGQSQVEFALMIGVSVATLRNWEQGRRTPDGPALALLRVTARNPEAVVEALHRGSSRGAA